MTAQAALNHRARRRARRLRRAGDHDVPRRPWWQRYYIGWKRERRDQRRMHIRVEYLNDRPLLREARR